MCYGSCWHTRFFFFFKQKTAYEMRISDWSSDVCSSDLDQQTAYALSAQKAPDGAAPAKGGDAVRFWRERRFDDLECLKARFFRHAYAPHAHDTFALGVILAGAEA